MKDFTEMEFFPLQEELVKVIQTKIQHENTEFFRNITAFYFAQVATMMRTQVEFPGMDSLPANMYCINLSNSGSGKGLSTSLLEKKVIKGFKSRFLNETLPTISDQHIDILANQRASKNGTEKEIEVESLNREYNQAGPVAFSFDSGTTAAVKQMRHKLLMANCGSINLVMDEAFSNLLGNTEVLSTYLELFDGSVKQKLLKNTKENVRNEEIDGITPTNMLLFGTPTKLFNNPKIEEEFNSMMETGYARRCFFGFSDKQNINHNITPEERYNNLVDKSSEKVLSRVYAKFTVLAGVDFYNRKIRVNRIIATLFLEYEIECQKIANKLPEHMEVAKAEISHRYFKAVKLAGVYAFIDGVVDMKESHAYAAIKMTEFSGAAFDRMSNKKGNHIKLANYIRDVSNEITQVDLMDSLPFYRGTEAVRKELMNLAIIYGYKNNIIIKKYYQDDIEFLKGESIPETNLDEINISYSMHPAEGYKPDTVKFNKIHKLTQASGYNWCVHHFIEDYRSSEKVIQGFNLVVIDVDDGVTMDVVRLLLHDMAYHIYTTKRHTPEKHRFRIVFPLSHTLKLNRRDYSEFMHNVFEWLPFSCDAQTADIPRKWLSHKGEYSYNDGELLDAFSFIPKTKKLETRKKEIKHFGSLSGLERWFINNTAEGNRSNQFIRYAYMLVDMGYSAEDTRDKLLALNTKLPDKLEESEILGTILVSVTKKIQQENR